MSVRMKAPPGRPAPLRVRVVALAVATACLTIGCHIPTALADAAIGHAAFDRGDYVRAMAEWTNAAERGDPDAQFGLGMLHERGDGALRQSYKEADSWYQKAAEQGHVGAQYRLALIWAAGSDDLPADLVEAHKWILLAAERGLASDVKALLEQAIHRGQQEEGLQRAASWKAARAAEKAQAEAAAAAAAAATAPVAASGAATTSGTKSGGCPGWPFPTLPCTEQFPALPGATPPRSLALPPPRPPGPN